MPRYCKLPPLNSIWPSPPLPRVRFSRAIAIRDHVPPLSNSYALASTSQTQDYSLIFRFDTHETR